MKRTPVLFLALALLGSITTAFLHVHSRRVCTTLEHERTQLATDTLRLQADAAEANRQLAAARARVATAPAPAGAPPARHAADLPPATPTAAAPRPPDAPALPAAEMRRLRVQTFVGEQRMQFAPVLHRLGFTPAQRQTFDRLKEEFFSAMLDEKLTAADREQVREAHAAALRELFGANYEAWREANQEAPARAIVDGIIHQTFPSSGALTAAQADELTRIVAQHRQPASANGGSARYDWEGIVTTAGTILADRQMQDFSAAVRHRRASEQMSALAAKTKR